MQDKSSETSRNPNAIEQFIIERHVKNTCIGYIEAFILILACDLVVWYLVFSSFRESLIMGFLGVLMALLIAFLLLVFWLTIKDAKIKPYTIILDKGNWSVKTEGTGKGINVVSRVNGRKIVVIVPEMANIPRYGETQHIEYEYVNIFDSPPFGHDNIFISIEKKGFTDKDKTYIQHLEPIGILSIFLSFSFLFTLLFCFLTKFNTPSIIYLSIGLFFVFLRTVLRWHTNVVLRKSLKQENHPT